MDSTQNNSTTTETHESAQPTNEEMEGVRNEPAEGEPQGEQQEPQPQGEIDYTNIDTKEIFDGLDVPEGFEVRLDTENEAYKWWSEFAKENNIPKDQFIGGIQSFVKQQLADMGDPDAEIQKLGENGQQIIQDVDHWLSETLKRAAGGILMNALFTVKANIEAIIA